MLLSDFEPEFIAKIDQYLQEGLIPHVVGGCSARQPRFTTMPTRTL